MTRGVFRREQHAVFYERYAVSLTEKSRVSVKTL